MSYKLICFDMDGVIFKDINFWMELHNKFGTLDEGIELALCPHSLRLLLTIFALVFTGKNLNCC